MLTITDKSGKVKFVVFDEATGPVSIDDLIIKDSETEEEEEDGDKDASTKKLNNPSTD